MISFSKMNEGKKLSAPIKKSGNLPVKPLYSKEVMIYFTNADLLNEQLWKSNLEIPTASNNASNNVPPTIRKIKQYNNALKKITNKYEYDRMLDPKSNHFVQSTSGGFSFFSKLPPKKNETNKLVSKKSFKNFKQDWNFNKFWKKNILLK